MHGHRIGRAEQDVRFCRVKRDRRGIFDMLGLDKNRHFRFGESNLGRNRGG